MYNTNFEGIPVHRSSASKSPSFSGCNNNFGATKIYVLEHDSYPVSLTCVAFNRASTSFLLRCLAALGLLVFLKRWFPNTHFLAGTSKDVPTADFCTYVHLGLSSTSYFPLEVRITVCPFFQQPSQYSLEDIYINWYRISFPRNLTYPPTTIFPAHLPKKWLYYLDSLKIFLKIKKTVHNVWGGL